MFTPHNEHRVFFTRLYALDVVLANGQWDPRVQQVCNAALHSFTAVLLAMIFWLASNRRHLDLIGWRAPSRSRCRSPAEHDSRVPVTLLFPGPLFDPGVVAHDQVPTWQHRLASWLGMGGVGAVYRCGAAPRSRGHLEYRRAEVRELS